MFSSIPPARTSFLRSLPALQAVRLLVNGEFKIGEDDLLIEAIRAGARIRCDKEAMWDILHDAMDDETDPQTVLAQLEQAD